MRRVVNILLIKRCIYSWTKCKPLPFRCALFQLRHAHMRKDTRLSTHICIPERLRLEQGYNTTTMVIIPVSFSGSHNESLGIKHTPVWADASLSCVSELGGQGSPNSNAHICRVKDDHWSISTQLHRYTLDSFSTLSYQHLEEYVKEFWFQNFPPNSSPHTSSLHLLDYAGIIFSIIGKVEYEWIMLE